MCKLLVAFLMFLHLPQLTSAQQEPNMIYGFPATHGKMLGRKYYVVSSRTDAKAPEWTLAQRSGYFLAAQGAFLLL